MGGTPFVAVLRACFAGAGFFVAGLAHGQDAALQQVRVALDRALGTPMEIVWLREELLAQLWRENPALAQRSAACAAPGGLREGCVIGSRPAQRYHLGAGSPAGRGIYIVAPRAGYSGLARAPGGELVLAAGGAVQLVDGAYPDIRIEIRAPADRPLPLGNLVSADIHRLAALLAQPQAPRVPVQKRTLVASAAPLPDIDQRTRVAVRANGEGNAADVVLYAPAVEKSEAATFVPLPDLDQRTHVAVSANGEGNGTEVVLYAPVAEKIIVASMAALPDIDQLTRAVVQANGEGNGIEVVVYAAPAAATVPVALAAPSDIARLRAEIEAEIERERARVAALLKPQTAPRRFAFSGA